MNSPHHDDIEKGTISHEDTVSRPVEKPFQNDFPAPVALSPLGRPHVVANPAPLGLFSFATTTIILSMFNAGVRDVTIPNIIVGMAFWCGGVTHLICGLLEYPRGNMFGATVFTLYAAFWMSIGTLYHPAFGVQEAYANNPHEFSNVMGLFLVAWTIVSFFMLIVTIRLSVIFTGTFILLTLTFSLLAAANLSGITALTKAGGVTGIIMSFAAYYIGLSELLAGHKTSIIQLPMF